MRISCGTDSYVCAFLNVSYTRTRKQAITKEQTHTCKSAHPTHERVHQSVSVSFCMCLCVPVCVSMCLYVSLCISMYLYVSLCVCMCLYVPLYASFSVSPCGLQRVSMHLSVSISGCFCTRPNGNYISLSNT